MKPLILGLGRAGCRIGSLFLDRGKYSGVLLDTDKAELFYHKHKYKLLLGKELLDGNGTAMNLSLGRRAVEGEGHGIVERLDTVKKEADCFFVISGLGGGTGGAVVALLEELKKNYPEPVYYAAVLPSEEEHPRVVSNFAAVFREAALTCDAVFPIDNNSLAGRLPLRGAYSRINEVVYTRFSTLFEIGEYRYGPTGGSILSTRDVINTLSGVSTIGAAFSGASLEEVLNRKGGGIDKPALVVSLTKEAMDNFLVPVEAEETGKALVAVVGPKKYLDFIGSIPARLWVEDKIRGLEVRGGDLILYSRNNLEVMVLLSGIKKSDRIKRLYQLGKAAMDREAFTGELFKTLGELESLNKKIREIEEEFSALYDHVKDLARDREEG